MGGRISEERQLEIQELTQKLDYMERELSEKYCDVGKSILEKVACK